MEYIWLSGTKEEIEAMKEAFKAKGFTFSQGSEIPISEDIAIGPNRYSSALKNFQVAVVPTPQPKPWDAVLGGKK